MCQQVRFTTTDYMYRRYSKTDTAPTFDMPNQWLTMFNYRSVPGYVKT